MVKVNCKEMVLKDKALSPHQCSRKAWMDGFCKQHHPEEVTKKLYYIL